MATNLNRDSNPPDGDQPHYLQALKDSLKKRIGAGSSSTSTPTTASVPSSGLEQQLHLILNGISSKASPRSPYPSTGFGRGSPRRHRSCQGLSSTPSASSDSSGGHWSNTSKETESGKGLAPVGSMKSLRSAASAKPLFLMGSSSNHIAAGDTESSVIGQVGGGELTPNSPMSSTTVGRGKNILRASGVIGKTKPKRRRPSKKPFTKIIETSQERFRATVQELTGCTSQAAQVVRPEPERPQPERLQQEHPQAKSVPIVVSMVANPPARPNSSSTPRVSVPSPSPTVSNRVPEATFLFQDSSGSVSSSSRSSGLNYCMGYQQTVFPFPEEPPEDSGIPDDDLQPASDYGYSRKPMQYPSDEDGASAPTPTGASFKPAVPSVSESVEKKENIPKGHSSPGLAKPDDFMKPLPCEFLVPRKPREPNYDDLEEEFLDFDAYFCTDVFDGFR